MKNKKRKKYHINPVAKAMATGEHGARRITMLHKNKKKYTRKNKKSHSTTDSALDF